MAYIRKTKDLIISEELREMLESFKDRSLVATLLLKRRHDLENLQENTIDFISFSNSDKTRLSYLTPDRIERMSQTGEDFWSSNKRYHGKPGVVVGKIFKNLSDVDVQIFSTYIRNMQSKLRYTFKVVSGEELVKYYKQENYSKNSGSLGSSCMKWDNCQVYLNIYRDNPETIKMLVMLDSAGMVLGRALLWEQGEIKIMDRIYSVDDEECQFHFKKWADSNNYWYKREQKWNNTLNFESNGEVLKKEITIELKNSEHRRYPYMDTFKFLDIDNGVIRNFKKMDSNNSLNLSSAEGSWIGFDSMSYCDISDLLYHSGDIIHIDYCNKNVFRELCVWSQIYNQYILPDDAVWSDSIDSWIYKNDELNDVELIEKYKNRNKIKLSGSFAAIRGIPVNVDPTWLEPMNMPQDMQENQ